MDNVNPQILHAYSVPVIGKWASAGFSSLGFTPYLGRFFLKHVPREDICRNTSLEFSLDYRVKEEAWVNIPHESKGDDKVIKGAKMIYLTASDCFQ